VEILRTGEKQTAVKWFRGLPGQRTGRFPDYQLVGEHDIQFRIVPVGNELVKVRGGLFADFGYGLPDGG
jgi:hypothetical protein